MAEAVITIDKYDYDIAKEECVADMAASLYLMVKHFPGSFKYIIGDLSYDDTKRFDEMFFGEVPTMREIEGESPYIYWHKQGERKRYLLDDDDSDK